MKRRIALPPPHGRAVARHPKSWDEEFEVVVREGGAPPAPFARMGAFAVVDICGALVQREHWIVDSYDAIRERAKAAFESDQPAVMLRIASPGGDFFGALDLSRTLRSMARTSGKKLVAFTDAEAASAAYAIGCAADEFVISESALVGSIGVWVSLMSQAELNAKMGISVRILASGARKLDRNPNVPISDDAAEATQEKVDMMARLFFELVSEQRALSLGRIAALEGDEVLGANAVAVGLADRLESFDRLVGGVLTVSSTSATTSTGAAMAKAEDKNEEKKDGFDEALATLHKIADGEDKDRAARARRMLSAMYEEGESKGKGETPEEPEKGKAAEKEPEKEKEAEGEKTAAAAASGGSATELSLAARVHALEAAAAQKALDDERRTLLATRPDFSAEIVATLSKQPIDAIREACTKWPKIPGKARAQALSAAANVTGTRGEQQTGTPTDALEVPPDEASFIDKKMGLRSASRGTRVTERSLELGVMTHEQAAARAAALTKELETSGEVA